jgi:GNAT superfamily N-acetyltransferase
VAFFHAFFWERAMSDMLMEPTLNNGEYKMNESDGNTVLYHSNGINYVTLQEDRLDEIIDCVAKLFAEQEYITRESGLTVDEFKVFAEQYCRASLLHNLSIIAVVETTRELVGFAINEDPMADIAVDANQFYQVSDHYKPFLGMLGALNEKCWNLDRKVGFSFHLYLLGVKSDFQRQQIGTTLVKVSEILAKANNFEYMVIEATSPHTKPICEKLGYSSLGNIPYVDYVLDGTKPFSHIQDYDGPYLFTKRL